MARKPKNPKWGTRGGWFAREDADFVVPTKPDWRTNPLYTTSSALRNLGVAIVNYTHSSRFSDRIVVYGHSQVSNAPEREDMMPPAVLILGLEEAEQLMTMLLQAITAYNQTT